MPKSRILPVLLVGLLLAAAQAQPATTIELQVTGGDHEGRYAVTSDEPTCTYGYAGAGVWGNQYSVFDVGPEVFSSLQLLVDAASAADGATDFSATIHFGEFFGGVSYDLRPHADVGRGTVTLDDRGDSATVTISGTTDEGVGIEATIECHVVLRSGPALNGDGDGGDRGGGGRDDDEYDYESVGPVELTVAGLTHEFVAAADEAWCEEDFDGDVAFYYSFQSGDEDAGIHLLELYVPEIPSAGAAGGFLLLVYGQELELSMDTVEGDEGSGVLTLTSAGGEHSVELKGVTAEGEPLTLMLSCRSE